MKKTWTRWTLAVVLLLVVVAVIFWSNRRGALVHAVAVSRAAIVQSVVATGRINAPARLELSAEVTATVQAVHVREGERVRAGQVLVQLSDAEARAALAQAQAAWHEAQRRLEQQAQVAAPVAVQTLVQAEAAWHAAQREHERVSELVRRGFYSQQKLDDAVRALDTARSARASAQVQAQANQTEGVEAALAQVRVVQAKAAWEAAQARLARLRVVAPTDAVVLSRLTEPGNMAQPGKVLLTLAAAGTTRIDAAVDEKHLRLLQPGMAAQADADAYPGQPFSARLDYIAPSVDPQRGTVEVRLNVEQPPDFLRPDMTVSVELMSGRKTDALVLPASAVRDADRAEPWVLTVDAGRAVKQPVKLGLKGVGSVEVVSGLNEGAWVIPQTEKAAVGDAVRIQPQASRTAGFEVPSFVSR